MDNQLSRSLVSVAPLYELSHKEFEEVVDYLTHFSLVKMNDGADVLVRVPKELATKNLVARLTPMDRFGCDDVRVLEV